MLCKFGDIPYVEVPRLSTGIPELDWLYGGRGPSWGLPLRKISLWSGPAGSGKSRSLISTAYKISCLGHKVLYFQNEVNLSDFRSWARNVSIPSTFSVSDSSDIESQVADILSVRPSVIVIDSLNQLKEFGNGSKAAIKHIYDCYRQVLQDVNAHIIFVCQLSKSGEIKGGSELLFLSDASINLHPYILKGVKMNGYFTAGVDTKNRDGKAGIYTIWKHCDFGAKCVSTSRFYDGDWCRENGYKLIEYGRVPYGSPGCELFIYSPIYHIADVVKLQEILPEIEEFCKVRQLIRV